MKYLLSGFLLVLCLSADGQTMKDAISLFEKGQLDSSIATAKQYMQTEPGAYQLIGQSLVKQGKYAEAIMYLEKGKNSLNAEPSVRAWCMNDLGIAWFMRGAYEKAKENIKACIDLNATTNSVRSAREAAILFGLSELYDSWARKESTHFVFHFQHIPDNAEFYIAANEMAYDSINRFFRSTLPKKIDYFVWDDTKLAERTFHQPLAFTKTLFCVTHTSMHNTRGHEITHNISMYANTVKKPNMLVFEGIASYFDFSGRDWMKEIKKIAPHIGYIISIKSIWLSSEHTPVTILYPAGALLTGSLIQQFGREKFIQLLADQSYENAKKLYGSALDELIAGLDREINSN